MSTISYAFLNIKIEFRFLWQRTHIHGNDKANFKQTSFDVCLALIGTGFDGEKVVPCFF